MTCQCDCCAGVEAVTPVPEFNRPGLPALVRRTGDYGTFRESMLARLSSRRELDPLTTRDPDDPAIALLECWAVVGDVLTFYQERIANEGYLRTATEPQSITLLGRLVGHIPRPALASSTYLAYTLDPGAHSFIPAGSSAKSQAANGGLPQTFETSEDLVAREEWNTLAVRKADPPNITTNNVDSLTDLAVDGTSANLRKGDRLLFEFAVTGGNQTFRARTVEAATPDFTAGRTAVTLTSNTSPFSDYHKAIVDLNDAVTQALVPPIVTADPAVAELVTELDNLAAFLQPTPPPTPPPTPDNVLNSVGAYVRRLAEESALAARGADCELADWLNTKLGSVLTRGRALIAIATRLTRRSTPEMEHLRQLAESLVCVGVSGSSVTPSGMMARIDECPERYSAVGLVGLTPILPALRRGPSRPPRSARFLDTPVQKLFQPDSDTHPRLLAAADRRLTQVYEAWRNAQITPPPPLAALSVLRLKATIAQLSKNADDEQPPVPTRENPDLILLDNVYDAITPGRPVLAGTDEGSKTVVLLPDRVSQTKLSISVGGGNTTTIPVTMLEFDQPVELQTAPLAPGMPIWALPDPLTPLGAPVLDDVGQAAIDLAQCYDGLKPGRLVIVAGERTDVPYTDGIRATELAMVAGVSQRLDRTLDGEPVLQPGQGPQTRLLLANELAYTYKPSTVKIYGNVVAATQGETRPDILGNGNAGQAGQTFALHLVSDKTPLTWTAADNPLGAANTLTVRVGGVAWHETDALALSRPTGHDYVLHSDPGNGPGSPGNESVAFGDGVHGARLPSGTQNVTATYRTGAGVPGNIAVDKINQLAARPLGVNAVTNPLPATGGTDADGPDDARAVIPLRLRALDRLVSVRDYEDFTRARAGIAKASATKLFDGAREVVHVTFATVGDVPADPLSDLFTGLERALRDFGDQAVPVRVAERELRLIILDAGIKVLPDYSWELVEPAVRAALTAEFGFATRQLGWPAYVSEAIATIQNVEGVDYVDVHGFDDVPGDITPIQLVRLAKCLTAAKPCLPALPAHFEHTEYPPVPDDTLSTVAQRFGLHLDELAVLNPKLTTIDLTNTLALTVYRGVRPAQLAVLPADVPEALTLRRIP
jgi:hypothetical protein